MMQSKEWMNLLYTVHVHSFFFLFCRLSISSFMFSFHLPSSHSFTAQHWKMMLFQVSHNADAVPAWMEIAFIPSSLSAVPTFSHRLWFAFDTQGMRSGKCSTGLEKRAEMFFSSGLIRPVWRMEAEIWTLWGYINICFLILPWSSQH